MIIWLYCLYLTLISFYNSIILWSLFVSAFRKFYAKQFEAFKRRVNLNIVQSNSDQMPIAQRNSFQMYNVFFFVYTKVKLSQHLDMHFAFLRVYKNWAGNKTKQHVVPVIVKKGHWDGREETERRTELWASKQKTSRSCCACVCVCAVKATVIRSKYLRNGAKTQMHIKCVRQEATPRKLTLAEWKWNKKKIKNYN